MPHTMPHPGLDLYRLLEHYNYHRYRNNPQSLHSFVPTYTNKMYPILCNTFGFAYPRYIVQKLLFHIL